MKHKDDFEERMPQKWVPCDLEAEYFKDDRKNARKERKLASQNDRSKYKKTDREKFIKSKEMHANIKLAKADLLKGRVLSINPQGFIVDSDNVLYTCSMRGLLKKDKTLFKNLITVGDFVLFQKTTENEGLIAHVEDRKSTLSRADNLSRRQEQLIAANIDQVIITTSVVSPPIKPFLVDRYIIAAMKGNMEPVIVVNKIDLLKKLDEEDQEIAVYKEFLKAYAAVNIPVIAVSTVTGEGIEELKNMMKDKASVFSGQSGVGKSSLINTMTGLNLKVGKTVDKTNKGSHTTTTAQLVPIHPSGFVIDTPGIKSFGVWNLKKDEVEGYFPEIARVGRLCKYPNCSHTHEEDCAVIQAVEKEELSFLRYASYQLLLESMSEKHVRR